MLPGFIVAELKRCLELGDTSGPDSYISSDADRTGHGLLRHRLHRRLDRADWGICRQPGRETVGIVASLISPADAPWRLGSYRIQPESLRNFGAAMFATSSVPTTLMVWWAAGFTVATLIFAVRSFSRRQL